MERRAAIEAGVAHLPLMLTVEQTLAVLGIGRSLAYSEIRRYLATDEPNSSGSAPAKWTRPADPSRPARRRCT
jgi:hypothetical protein